MQNKPNHEQQMAALRAALDALPMLEDEHLKIVRQKVAARMRLLVKSRTPTCAPVYTGFMALMVKQLEERDRGIVRPKLIKRG